MSRSTTRTATGRSFAENLAELPPPGRTGRTARTEGARERLLPVGLWLGDLLGALAPRIGETCLVVVDGERGAGGDALADALAQGGESPVVRLDALSPRTTRVVDVATLIGSCVVRPLLAGEGARWPAHDRASGRLIGWSELPASDVLILEGTDAAQHLDPAWISLLIRVEAFRPDRATPASGRGRTPRGTGPRPDLLVRNGPTIALEAVSARGRQALAAPRTDLDRTGRRSHPAPPPSR